MTELQLSEQLAVGADDLQWMLMRSSRNGLTGAVKWQPISFVRSTREILIRCIWESGYGDTGAVEAAGRLPDTFDGWKAAQHRQGTAPRRVPVKEAA